MDPFDFEEYVVNLYNRLGYSVRGTVAFGDDGADGVGKDAQGNKIIMQMKRYADGHLVGSPEIRDFIGSMAFYKVTCGIFVTTGYFSEPAKKTVREVDGLKIETVDKNRLLKLMELAYKKDAADYLEK